MPLMEAGRREMLFLTGTDHPKQRVPGQQHLLCAALPALMLPGLQPQPGS